MSKPMASALVGGLLLLSLTFPASAEIQTQTVDYQDGDVELQGFLAWDDAIGGKRPAVLVVHEWWGLNDYARKRATMLAELGYLAFAVDMYGKGKVTEHPKQASEWAGEIWANADAWQKRALAGLAVLREQKLADTERMAAIGYCFGGATVLQLAYAGADLDGVVSFHGSLPAPTQAEAQDIKAKLLIAHGAADAFISPPEIAKFQAALAAANADWQLIYYGGAHNGFTNPNAGQAGIKNLQYNEKADRRSWQHMRDFFAEIFGTDR